MPAAIWPARSAGCASAAAAAELLATSVAGFRPTRKRLAALDAGNELFSADARPPLRFLLDRRRPVFASRSRVHQLRLAVQGIERGTDLLPRGGSECCHMRAQAPCPAPLPHGVTAGLPALTVATADAALSQDTAPACGNT